MAVSQIASDNVGGGAAAFDAIKEAHPEGGKVLVVSVDPGISTTDARAEGFEERRRSRRVHLARRAVLAQRAGHRGGDRHRRTAEGPRHRGHLRREPVRRRRLGTGVKQAGKKAGHDRRLRRRTRPGQGLKEGTVQALVAQEPATIGEDGVAQALAAINGDDVEAEIQTGFHHHHRGQRRRRRRRRGLPVQPAELALRVRPADPSRPHPDPRAVRPRPTRGPRPPCPPASSPPSWWGTSRPRRAPRRSRPRPNGRCAGVPTSPCSTPATRATTPTRRTPRSRTSTPSRRS